MALGDVAGVWDAQADEFDDEPHHALVDPIIRGAWWDVLEQVLPPPPAVVADLGCGTGSMAALLVEFGHPGVGVDASPRMLELARSKAERLGADISFVAGDASAPPLADSSVDVVLTRHVVWALDNLDVALDGWFRLLRPFGRLVLIEGFWHTGAGIASDELVTLISRPGVSVDLVELNDPSLWGHSLTDSRYAVVAST